MLNIFLFYRTVARSLATTKSLNSNSAINILVLNRSKIKYKADSNNSLNSNVRDNVYYIIVPPANSDPFSSCDVDDEDEILLC